MKLTLITKRPEAGDAVTFVFQPPWPLKWRSGQYLQYELPHPAPDDRGASRWFTNSSAPHEGRVTITTRVLGHGASTFKQALTKLKPGDTIEASEPEGDFVVEDPTRDYIFIAGGIGITPYRAILLDLARRRQPINVTLLYGNRDNQIVFKDELERVAAEHPDLKIHYITQPQTITPEVIRQHVPDLAKPDFYISGPEPMVEAFTKMLTGMGVPEARQKRDDFPNYDWPLR